jgi:carbonic anhydrase/acetyltransferase-like protein (isoleucine patch superfamily)
VIFRALQVTLGFQNPKTPQKSYFYGMANVFEFNGYRPVIHPSSFIHPLAAVTGNVVIGKSVYVGPGAAIRGDWGEIIIEDGCNVQENCVIHMFPGTTVLLKESAHIGHGAIIHGATIGRNSLIGMNSVIMDDAEIGDECIIGALCFVPAGMKIERRKVVVGNPAKVIKDVSDEMIAWKTKGTQLYQQLPAECHATLKACEPLTRVPAFRPKQQGIYKTWTENKKKK